MKLTREESFDMFTDSNKSLELIRRILYQTNNENKLEYHSNRPYLIYDGDILRNKKGKILVVYNESGQKAKRYEKGKFEYLNFYKNQSDILVDIFLDCFNDLNIIVSEDLGNSVTYQITNSNKEILFEKSYLISEISKNKNISLTNFIKDYLNKLEGIIDDSNPKEININLMNKNVKEINVNVRVKYEDDRELNYSYTKTRESKKINYREF